MAHPHRSAEQLQERRGAPPHRSGQSRSGQDGCKGHPKASTHLRFLSEDAGGGACGAVWTAVARLHYLPYGLAPGTGKPGQAPLLAAGMAAGAMTAARRAETSP